MKKSKLVFLFAGQLRTFDSISVVKSWKKFFDNYDVLTYGCFWSKRGKSAYSINSSIALDVNSDEPISINAVKEVLHTDNIWLYDYNDFLSTLPKEYCNFKSSGYFGCSISHSFLRNEVCNKMTGCNMDIKFNPSSYTLIRPDLIWLTEPPPCFLEPNDFLWHNDNPQAYSQNRIYDIFMCSNKQNILKMGSMYEDILGLLEAVDSQFNNYLDPLDSCRLNYNYSVLSKIVIRGQDRLHVDVFREEHDIKRYEEIYTKNTLWGVS